MKKHIFPRMIGLLVLYTGVLILLGMVQFSAKGTFIKQVGNLMVTGHYHSQENSNYYSLSGESKVSFGGLEFTISNRNHGFGLIGLDGNKEYILPEYIAISDKAVIFEIPGGTKLVFTNQYVDANPGLMIHAVFGEGTAGLELPYKPLRGSKIQERGNGQFTLTANGITYQFTRALTRDERSEPQILRLYTQGPFISYQAAAPEVREQPFDLKDFILSSAQDKQSYDKGIARWQDQSFSRWSKSISTANNEELVLAYIGEAANRGVYGPAISQVPSIFLNGNQRTYASTVFLGRLDLGLRSLASAERDKENRLSLLINTQSLEFLKDPHVFEYLALRGSLTLIEEGVKIIRTLNPEDLSPDLIIGILEGASDWNLYRTTMEKTSIPQNPFDGLINQVYLIISQGIKKGYAGDRVFVFYDGIADIEFNLRLGKAIMGYADSIGNNDWAGLGRSLILSVISLLNESETLPAILHLSEGGTISEDPKDPKLSAAHLYSILTPGENYPHRVSIGTPASGIWAWTGASSISVSHENNILDISVSFPVGETHYMLIRGISLPSRIQLYNMDYRTAPDFERYNSSGWSYSASEQTLLIKMRHRSSLEHVKIFN